MYFALACYANERKYGLHAHYGTVDPSNITLARIHKQHLGCFLARPWYGI